MTRSGGAPWLALPLVLFSGVGWSQNNPYIYVKMPLMPCRGRCTSYFSARS